MNTNKHNTERNRSAVINRQESRMRIISGRSEINENKEQILYFDRLIKEREKEINRVRLYIEKVYHNT